MTPDKLTRYLDQQEALANKATEWPWSTHDKQVRMNWNILIIAGDDVAIASLGNTECCQDDAAFIAASREAVPKLARIVRTMAEVIEAHRVAGTISPDGCWTRVEKAESTLAALIEGLKI